jgi:DNA-binding XRE family transcriptional regulator
MLTEDRSAQNGLSDPAVRALAQSIKQLSPADFDELLDLVRRLHQTDDQEEYDSWIRAIEELLEPQPTDTESFPLEEEPMPAGLRKWAEHVGGRIRELRKKASMTQVDLAKAAGLTQSHVSRLENAEHSATHLTLTKIAKALGVDVGQLDPCID